MSVAANSVRTRVWAIEGASLLEMILVLALMAFVALLAAGAMGGGLDGARLRSTGKMLASELRHTRTQAILDGSPRWFELDVRHHRWRGVNGRHGELPRELDLYFVGLYETQERTDGGVVQFFPDGASSGGRFEFRDGGAIWRIDINWITGEVRSGPVSGDKQ